VESWSALFCLLVRWEPWEVAFFSSQEKRSVGV